MTAQRFAAEFHEAFDCLYSPVLVVSPDEVRARMAEREQILREEFDEYIEARRDGDVVAVARELADVLYVLYGDAVALGIDAEAVLAEVHRANMTKLWDDGAPRYREGDGKVLKPPGFTPPDVWRVLRRVKS